MTTETQTENTVAGGTEYPGVGDGTNAGGEGIVGGATSDAVEPVQPVAEGEAPQTA